MTLPAEVMSQMSHRMTTTTFTLEGFRVVETKGVVRGIMVRSRNIFGTIGASLQAIMGGNITLLTELCETTRLAAFNLMLEHARKAGANAVIGVRYDATEVLCYGPAVVVEPEK